jgi:hypothetical protein
MQIVAAPSAPATVNVPGCFAVLIICCACIWGREMKKMNADSNILVFIINS